jgi:hypothetical protein
MAATCNGWARPGHVLNEDECPQLRHTAERRDKWIENYQRMELAKSGQVADHAAYIRELRGCAPLTGYVMQEGFSEGLHADDWRGRKSSANRRFAQKETIANWRLC